MGRLGERVINDPPTTEELRNAFLRAQREIGWKWKLIGRGQAPRSSVKSHVGRAIGGLKLHRASLHVGYSTRTLYPLALVERAAQILDVSAKKLIGSSY